MNRYTIIIFFLLSIFLVIGCSNSDKNTSDNNREKFDIVKQFQSEDGNIQTFVSYKREEISVAEKLNISIEIHKTSDTIVIFPKEKDFILDKLSIDRIGSLERDTENGTDILKKQITIIPEELGEASIDSIIIRYTLEDKEMSFKTSPIQFDIVSFTGKPADSVEFEEKLQPESIQYDYSILITWLIIGGIAIIIIIGVILLIIYFRKRNKSDTALEIIPAHIIALKELNDLEEKELAEKGHIGEFHHRLSVILRDYIENRFDIRAPEQTTEEFMQEMSTTKRIGEEHKDLLKEYLTQCDLIKFAKFRPPIQYHKEAMNRARTFIEATAENQLKEDSFDDKKSNIIQNEEKEVSKA